MIGKPITGKGFGGCVRYVVNKANALILDAEGVRTQSAKTITQDFDLQRSMRPGLGKAVGHIVLSWSKEDLPKLTDTIMAERAKEYMEKMGIRNTQYVMVRHNDREHPHVHIIYNRVDNNGKTISDNNNYERNIKACKEITLKYGYHIGKGKELVNRQALRGKEKLRYQLYDAIKSAVKLSPNWKALESSLQKQGVVIQYKFRNGTNEVQGISFEKNGFTMKGSAIDRAFSYSRIDAQLNQNDNQAQSKTTSHSPSLGDQLREIIRQPVHHPSFNSGPGLLDALLQPEYIASGPATVDDITKRKKKKKNHSKGISR